MQMKSFSFLPAVLILSGNFLAPVAFAVGAELETVAVESTEIANVRWFDGVIEAVNIATVSAQTSGRIVSLNFDVNDSVKAGEVIARFSDVEHKARLAQAIASVDAATATRLGAEEEFQRVEKLLARGVVAKSQFDSAKANFDATLGQQQTAEAALDQAREQLDYTIVRAPYSGLVKERHVELGELASPGQPLITGFSLEKLRVTLSVPQRFAQTIRDNHQAEVVDHAGNTVESNNITVFPFAEEDSHTVTVRVELPDNVLNFFPGMLIKTAFKVGVAEALMVPESSIVRRGEVYGVYLVNDGGRLQLQQIRIGRIDADSVEVVSGLMDGDVIAVDAMVAAQIRLSQSRAVDE